MIWDSNVPALPNINTWNFGSKLTENPISADEIPRAERIAQANRVRNTPFPPRREGEHPVEMVDLASFSRNHPFPSSPTQAPGKDT